ncbi:MAG TPA: hypothetical protein PKD83_04330 [Ignavibacteria bacterium]|nr:hypothetical protein [Ignavibacteria bacterium]
MKVNGSAKIKIDLRGIMKTNCPKCFSACSQSACPTKLGDWEPVFKAVKQLAVKQLAVNS